MFNRIFAKLAGKAGEPERILIDATHFKAHRTAASATGSRMSLEGSKTRGVSPPAKTNARTSASAGASTSSRQSPSPHPKLLATINEF